MPRKNLQRKSYLMNHGYYRPKMYKSGKNWMVVGMTILSLMGGASMAQKLDAHADNINNKLNNQSNQQTNISNKKPTINNIQSQANSLHNRIMNNNSAYQNGTTINQDNTTKNFIPQNSQERVNPQTNNGNVTTPSNNLTSTHITYSSIKQSNTSNNSINKYNQKSVQNASNNSSENKRTTMFKSNSNSKNKTNQKYGRKNNKPKLNPITLGHGNLHQRISNHNQHFSKQQNPYVVKDDGNKYSYNSQTSRNFNGKYSDLVNKKQKAQINKSNQQAQYQMPMMKLRETNQVDLGSFDKKQRKELNNVEKVGGFQNEKLVFDSGLTGIAYSNGEVDFGGGTANSDLSKFSTSNSDVQNARVIKFSSDIDTSHVTNMTRMFASDKALQNINFGQHFDTSNVTDMYQMFSGDTSLRTLTLPESFNTSKVSDMFMMFDLSLQSLTIQSPNTKISFWAEPTMYKETGGKDSQGNPYTLSTPNDFTKGNIGTFTSNKNVKKDQYVDIYNSTDGFTVPTIKSDSSLPSNWTFVSDTSGKESKTAHSDGKGNIMIAPIYKGLIYKYNRSKNSIEFTNGTADSDLAYFASQLPFSNKPTKFTFDNNINMSHAEDMRYMFGNPIESKKSNISDINFGNSFNTSNVTDMSWMFSNTTLAHLNVSTFNTRNVTNMEYMFESDRKLQSLNLGNNFDTSNVTDMNSMFSNTQALQSLQLNSDFNTKNVTNMSYMFDDTGLQGLILPSSFDTSKVTNMSDMFAAMDNLQTFTLPKSFITKNVTNMENMFSGTNLQKLTIQSSDTKLGSDVDLPKMYKELTTDGEISDGSNVKKDSNGTPYTASDANDFNNGNIGTFITNKNIQQYEYSDIFNVTDKFTVPNKPSNPYLPLPSFWTYVSNHSGTISNKPIRDSRTNKIMIAPIYDGMVYDYVKSDNSITFMNGTAYSDLNHMFATSGIPSALTNANTVSFSSNVDTSNVTNMNCMFASDKNLHTINFSKEFNTQKVKDMGSMFINDSYLSNINGLNHFDTSDVTDMSEMFCGDESLEKLNLNSFNTSNVTNMNAMFASNSKLQSLTLPNTFNTSKVTDMGNMFEQDQSLRELNLPNPAFNTGRVTNMLEMFADDKNLSLLTLPDSFNTSNVKQMYMMFDGDSNLYTLTLPSSFHTNKVTNMAMMFQGDSSLQSLNLSSFNTSQVTRMDGMINSDKHLQTLILPNTFNTSNVTDISVMFQDDSSLKNLTLPNSFNTSKADDSDAFGNDNLYKLTIQSSNTKFDSKSGLGIMYKELTTDGGVSDGYNVEKDSKGRPYTKSDIHDFSTGEIGTYIAKNNPKPQYISYNNQNINIEYDSPGDHTKRINGFNPKFNIQQPANNMLTSSDIIRQVKGLPKGISIIRTSDSKNNNIGNIALQPNQQYTIHITTPPITAHYIYEGKEIASGVLSQDEDGQLPSALNGGTKINTDNKGNALSNLNSRVAQSILKGKAKNLQATQVRVISKGSDFNSWIKNYDRENDAHKIRIHYVTSSDLPYANYHEIHSDYSGSIYGNNLSLSKYLHKQLAKNYVPVKVFDSDNRTITTGNNLSNDNFSVQLTEPIEQLYIQEKQVDGKKLKNIPNVNYDANLPYHGWGSYDIQGGNQDSIEPSSESKIVNWNNLPQDVYIYLNNNQDPTLSTKDAVVAEYHEGSNDSGIIKKIPLEVKGKASNGTQPLSTYLTNAQSNILNQLDNGTINGFQTSNFSPDHLITFNIVYGKPFTMEQLMNDANHHIPIKLMFKSNPDTITVNYYDGTQHVGQWQLSGVNDESDVDITLPESDIGSATDPDKYPTNAMGLSSSDSFTGDNYEIPSDFEGNNIDFGNYSKYGDYFDTQDGTYHVQVVKLDNGSDDSVDPKNLPVNLSISSNTIKKGRDLSTSAIRPKDIRTKRHNNNNKHKKQRKSTVAQKLFKHKNIYINKHKKR